MTGKNELQSVGGSFRGLL